MRTLLAAAALAALVPAAPAAARCDDVVRRVTGQCLPICPLTYDPIQQLNELLDPHAYVAPCVH